MLLSTAPVNPALGDTMNNRVFATEENQSSAKAIQFQSKTKVCA
jgi:hypothetical protein